jgi:hypothetical protein
MPVKACATEKEIDPARRKIRQRNTATKCGDPLRAVFAPIAHRLRADFEAIQQPMEAPLPGRYGSCRTGGHTGQLKDA